MVSVSIKAHILLLFFHIMKGEYDNLLEWPFSKKVTLTLLDQTEKKDHKSFFIHPLTFNSELFSKPISQSKRFACLIPQSMAYPGYITDDTLMIKCEVEHKLSFFKTLVVPYRWFILIIYICSLKRF